MLCGRPPPGLRATTLFIAFITLAANTASAVEDGDRESRALGLFNIIRFGNEACNAASDSGVEGRCYKEDECESMGGKVDGGCAAGQYRSLFGDVARLFKC